MPTIEELEAALDWFNSHYAPSECKHYKPVTKALQQAIEIKRENVVVKRDLLEKWVDYSYLREPDDTYPTLREDTLNILKSSTGDRR